MLEVIRTAKVVISSLLLLLTSKVLLDLLRDKESLQHWGLIGLFVAITSTAVLVTILTYVVELPVWVHIWHIINLAIFVVSIYHMLKELENDI